MSRPRAFHEAPLPLFATGDADEATPVPLPGRLPSYIADHRHRLRSRFMAGGAAAMPDYELLELVLFRAIPRQDVKPLAHRLLDTFGDFNRVVTAPPARLTAVAGGGRGGGARAEDRRSGGATHDARPDHAPPGADLVGRAA